MALSRWNKNLFQNLTFRGEFLLPPFPKPVEPVGQPGAYAEGARGNSVHVRQVAA